MVTRVHQNPVSVILSVGKIKTSTETLTLVNGCLKNKKTETHIILINLVLLESSFISSHKAAVLNKYEGSESNKSTVTSLLFQECISSAGRVNVVLCSLECQIQVIQYTYVSCVSIKIQFVYKLQNLCVMH